ncbi:hypothetical protein EI77_00812 [Prosthecobacter fusiformis]|uniref:Uncharacterized protein n=1 Tax=Prosthecobacter fusiformis TaxID=48464 RepID=A0A4R7SQI1_9BACT|nr:hypothetical protein [Prosthecobacter fusiformis]TDU81502.1 hypothetical protein EI77_00812 [Prosthecobacter fusiformis]
MIRWKNLLPLLAGGAMMAPLFAFGHACEFLVARMEVKGDRLQMEITADYGGNPLISDEAAARDALKSILQVRTGTQTRSLEELAPLNIGHRSEWDPDAPTAFAPTLDGQPHQLLAAVWQWQADAAELSLTVPDGNLHDVLLWTRDETLPGKQAKWMMLIEGESTPVITLQKPRLMTGGMLVVILCVAGLLLTAWRAFGARGYR